MSRILRRPMFRGGRVDSRGTGITSGLGYAGGGSVNTPKRGLVNSPGRYSQTADNLQKWKDQLAIDEYKKPGTTKYTMPYIKGEFEKYLDNMYTGDISDVDMAYGMQVIPPMAKEDISTMNLMKKEGGQDTVFDLFYSGQLPGSDKINYKKLQEDQLAAAKLAGDLESFGLDTNKLPEEGESRPEFEERIRREAAEELQALIKSQTDKDPAEEIAKNKKIFQEAYGSGGGQDASRMLMTAASRLLEPEATVQSGLSKALGDEAKVESKRIKYKDAATTAAINAYLTGEKDYDSMMKQMKIIDYQIDKKATAAKANETLDVLLEAYAGNSGDRTDEGVMQAAFNQLFRDKKGYAGFLGPLPEKEEDLVVGAVYFADDPNDTRTKIIYEVDANGNPQKINSIFKQENLKWLYLNPSMINYEE